MHKYRTDVNFNGLRTKREKALEERLCMMICQSDPKTVENGLSQLYPYLKSLSGEDAIAFFASSIDNIGVSSFVETIIHLWCAYLTDIIETWTNYLAMTHRETEWYKNPHREDLSGKLPGVRAQNDKRLRRIAPKLRDAVMSSQLMVRQMDDALEAGDKDELSEAYYRELGRCLATYGTRDMMSLFVDNTNKLGDTLNVPGLKMMQVASRQLFGGDPGIELEDGSKIDESGIALPDEDNGQNEDEDERKYPPF